MVMPLEVRVVALHVNDGREHTELLKESGQVCVELKEGSEQSTIGRGLQPDNKLGWMGLCLKSKDPVWVGGPGFSRKSLLTCGSKQKHGGVDGTQCTGEFSLTVHGE